MLIDALDAQDANAILQAADDLYQSACAAASHGAWHSPVDAGSYDAASGLPSILNDVLTRICSAEFRVKYLTDYGARRIDILAQSGAIIPAKHPGSLFGARA